MSRAIEAAAPTRARAIGVGAGREPRQIGRYRLLGKRGAGLFGSVWLAEEIASREPVALRLFPRELTDKPNVAETIRRRARAIIETSRTHPGLVGVLEYGATEDGRLFAVMEQVDGLRLSQLLANRTRPDVPAALRLALEMGGPVEALHRMGLLHGALRPRNFAVVDGRVMLMDTETIALRDAPALQRLVAMQSPAQYLAPEQLQGLAVTEKTDVYAFALTLYELVSGQPPFHGSTREAVIAQQLNARPQPLRRRHGKVPLSVEVALVGALQKRQEQRPLMPRVLNHLATPAGATGGHRWKRAALAAAGVVAVAIGAPVAWSVLAPHSSVATPLAPPAFVPPPTAVVPVAPAPPSEAPAAAPAVPPTLQAAPTPEPAPGTAEDVMLFPGLEAVAPPLDTASPELLTLPGSRLAAPAEIEPRASAERRHPEPGAAAPARRTRAVGSGEPDPAAVIDWLLGPRNGG